MNGYLISMRLRAGIGILAAALVGSACEIVASDKATNKLMPTDITSSSGLQQQLDELKSITGYRPAAVAGTVDLPSADGLAYSAVEDAAIYKIPESKHSRSFVKIIDSLAMGGHVGGVASLLKDVCARAVELELQEEGPAAKPAPDKGQSCGRRISRHKVDAKAMEHDYRFLSDLVQEPFLTDTDYRLAAAHENIRRTLEWNAPAQEGKTEQYRLTWSSKGIQQVVLIFYGMNTQSIVLLKYRLVSYNSSAP